MEFVSSFLTAPPSLLVPLNLSYVKLLCSCQLQLEAIPDKWWTAFCSVSSHWSSQAKNPCLLIHRVFLRGSRHVTHVGLSYRRIILTNNVTTRFRWSWSMQLATATPRHNRRETKLIRCHHKLRIHVSYSFTFFSEWAAASSSWVLEIATSSITHDSPHRVKSVQRTRPPKLPGTTMHFAVKPESYCIITKTKSYHCSTSVSAVLAASQPRRVSMPAMASFQFRDRTKQDRTRAAPARTSLGFTHILDYFMIELNCNVCLGGTFKWSCHEVFR